MTNPDRRLPVENDEYGAFAARILAAFVRRAAKGDPEDLATLRKVIDGAEAGLQDAVDGLRAQGHSWSQIGEALGMTKQSAWERFSGRDSSGKPDGIAAS